MRNKEVQVIPWFIADSGYVRCQSQRLDPQKTVFVGALHGMLNAEGLCNIFNDLFGGVVYAGTYLLTITYTACMYDVRASITNLKY